MLKTDLHNSLEIIEEGTISKVDGPDELADTTS